MPRESIFSEKSQKSTEIYKVFVCLARSVCSEGPITVHHSGRAALVQLHSEQTAFTCEETCALIGSQTRRHTVNHTTLCNYNPDIARGAIRTDEGPLSTGRISSRNKGAVHKERRLILESIGHISTVYEVTEEIPIQVKAYGTIKNTVCSTVNAVRMERTLITQGAFASDRIIAGCCCTVSAYCQDVAEALMC